MLLGNRIGTWTSKGEPQEVQYFTIESYDGNSYTANIEFANDINIEFSEFIDGEWTDWASTKTIGPSILFNEKTRFRGTNNNLGQYTITSNKMWIRNQSRPVGKFKISGNILTLLNPTGVVPDFNTKVQCFSNFCYGCTNLYSAKDLILPDTTAYGCYQRMFCACTQLIEAPSLPANTVDAHAYDQMFYSCTKLNVQPLLSAMNLSVYSYSEMFSNTNIRSRPTLPALSVPDYCYRGMYSNSNLQQAPELPATNVGAYAYDSMFMNCTILLYTPTQLNCSNPGIGAYRNMFYGCGTNVTGLNNIPRIGVTTLPSLCCESMFENADFATSISLNLQSVESFGESCCHRMFTNSNYSKVSDSTAIFNENAICIGDYCFDEMFSNLDGGYLTIDSNELILPDCNGYSYTYKEMFSGTQVMFTSTYMPPQTSDTGLNIFKNVTEFGDYACYRMFADSNISSTPIIRIPTTINYTTAFDEMFDGCTNLSYVLYGADGWAYNCTDWLNNVPEQGTFYYVWGLDTSDSRIPSGWTTQYWTPPV